MPTGSRRLSTGFVRAAGYDNKVRRVLFALLGKELHTDEILRAAAELNKKIFEELQKRGVDKRDVIRVFIDFDVEDGKIVWKWDTLEIEVYKEEEEIGSKIGAILDEIDKKEEELEKHLEELIKIANKIRAIADEIDNMVESIKRERDRTGESI